MSAQSPSPMLGALEPAASLGDWVRAIDPVVRNVALVVIVAATAIARLNPAIALLLGSAAMAFVGWSKPDAIATHVEKTAVEAALHDLDLRLADGQLDQDAYTVRRAWILETAKF